jgi:hypothetical protein
LPESEQTELLREMRDLLRVMAEPALAQRDEKLRKILLQITGKSRAKAKAILLMDGLKAQKEIQKEAQVDAGDLSRLIKALRANSLLADNEKPKLVLSIPANFFEIAENKNG